MAVLKIALTPRRTSMSPAGVVSVESPLVSELLIDETTRLGSN